AKGKEQRKILEDVAYGKAYLQRAKETGDSRRAQLSGVLEAREQALASNVRAYPPARKELKEIDDQIRSEADDLNDLAVDEVAHLQSRYLDLQLEALKNNQLGQARSQVEAAKKNKAAKYAPRTLRQAEIDLRQAESVV